MLREPTLRRAESSFQGADGLRLFRRSWLPAEPRRVLILVHGYAEHSGRYDEMARWLVSRGCAVHAYDHRGHGRSQGTRCHVDSFAQLLDDLEQFLALVRSEHATLPLGLVGHSMGGLVTAAFLVQRRPVIHAAVTSGAALHLEGASGWRVAFARGLSRLLPRLPIGSGLDPQGLSRDPQVVRDYLEDPLVHRGMTASLGAELMQAARDTAERGHEVGVPLLMLHGEADPMCAPQGSRSFLSAVKAPGSALRLYPELRHEVFNEPEREAVYEDLWTWLEDLSR